MYRNWKSVFNNIHSSFVAFVFYSMYGKSFLPGTTHCSQGILSSLHVKVPTVSILVQPLDRNPWKHWTWIPIVHKAYNGQFKISPIKQQILVYVYK